MTEDVLLELSIFQRQAIEAVRKRIASQQLGQAWTGLVDEGTETPSGRPKVRTSTERSDTWALQSPCTSVAS